MSSSPVRKMRKLSQESCWPSITSTPFRPERNEDYSSLSLSSITDGSTLHSNRNAPERFSSASFSSDDQEKTNEAAESILEDQILLRYEMFFKKVKKIKLRGPTWNLYKPIATTFTLYRYLLEGIEKVHLVSDWFISHCKVVPHSATVYELYKFVFDCCGYQEFELKRHYTYPPDINKILNTASSLASKGKIFENGKHVFANLSRIALIIQNAIYYFISVFTLDAHDANILYSDVFEWFFKLLSEMSSRRDKQFVYTSFMFDLKLLTAICMVASTANLSDRRLILSKYIYEIYLSIIKICRSKFNIDYYLKVAFVDELKLWVKGFSNMFVNEFDCLTVIMSFLRNDPSKDVRLSSLNFVKNIITDKKFTSCIVNERYLNLSRIQALESAVYQRIFDKDITVAVKALETYHSLISSYYKYIKIKKNFTIIISIIYHKNFLMASLACKCIIEIMEQEDMNHYDLLLAIGKISRKHDKEKLPLLIEACLEHIKPQLQSWHLFMESFINEDVDTDLKLSLSRICLEIVNQCLKGESSKYRLNSPTKDSDETIGECIAANICPILQTIDKTARSEPLILKNYLKILLNINPQYLQNYSEHIFTFLTEQLMEAFDFYTDQDTLSVLLEFLLHLDYHFPDFSEYISAIVTRLKRSYSKKLLGKLDSVNSIKKEIILYTKVDMNDYISWSDIVSISLEVSNMEFLENILQLHHWNLIWSIRKILSLPSMADKKHQIPLFKERYNEFLNICTGIIKCPDIDKKMAGFERICETSLELYMELNQVHIDLDELTCCAEIVKTFNILVLNDKVNDRQMEKYAKYIIDMALTELLPMKVISYVVKYYNKYHKQFNEIIRTLFKLISDSKTEWEALIVINAMRLSFENSAEPVKENVKKTHKLCTHLILDKLITPKIVNTIIIYGINYVILAKCYDFVTTFEPLVKMSKETSRKESLKILNYIKTKKNDLDFTNIPMQYFMNGFQ